MEQPSVHFNKTFIQNIKNCDTAGNCIHSRDSEQARHIRQLGRHQEMPLKARSLLAPSLRRFGRLSFLFRANGIKFKKGFLLAPQ